MNTKNIRLLFPLFAHHPNMVYLDSAATTQKPRSVIEREATYYAHDCANIARGLYALSENATLEYEKTRIMTASFIHAQPEEIIFTRGTTESLNLLSYTLESHINTDDEVLVSITEHHSNFLPWQALAQRKNAQLTMLPLTKDGIIDTAQLSEYITERTKIFAFTAVSNVLGSINPTREIIKRVRAINPSTLIIVDAAQAMAHFPMNVTELDCDFLAFSAHKMFGPTGVGVLYGKSKHLKILPPFHYGGEMVLEARTDTSIFKGAPHKFEAGTPNIAGVIAFQEAITFIQSVGFKTIRAHEESLLSSAINKLTAIFGDAITIFGTQNISQRSGVIAFTLKNMHPHDIAGLLAERNICIRSGQHCTAPLHDSLQIPATARISLSIYTTQKDIDTFITALSEIYSTFTSYKNTHSTETH